MYDVCLRLLSSFFFKFQNKTVMFKNGTSVCKPVAHGQAKHVWRKLLGLRKKKVEQVGYIDKNIFEGFKVKLSNHRTANAV